MSIVPHGVLYFIPRKLGIPARLPLSPSVSSSVYLHGIGKLPLGEISEKLLVSTTHLPMIDCLLRGRLEELSRKKTHQVIISGNVQTEVKSIQFICLSLPACTAFMRCIPKKKVSLNDGKLIRSIDHTFFWDRLTLGGWVLDLGLTWRGHYFLFLFFPRRWIELLVNVDRNDRPLLAPLAQWKSIIGRESSSRNTCVVPIWASLISVQITW